MWLFLTLKLSLNNFRTLIRWWQYSQWINYLAKWSQITDFSYFPSNWLITLFCQTNEEESGEEANFYKVFAGVLHTSFHLMFTLRWPLFPFYRWENRGLERLGVKITEVVKTVTTVPFSYYNIVCPNAQVAEIWTNRHFPQQQRTKTTWMIQISNAYWRRLFLLNQGGGAMKSNSSW